MAGGNTTGSRHIGNSRWKSNTQQNHFKRHMEILHVEEILYIAAGNPTQSTQIATAGWNSTGNRHTVNGRWKSNHSQSTDCDGLNTEKKEHTITLHFFKASSVNYLQETYFGNKTQSTPSKRLVKTHLPRINTKEPAEKANVPRTHTGINTHMEQPSPQHKKLKLTEWRRWLTW